MPIPVCSGAIAIRHASCRTKCEGPTGATNHNILWWLPAPPPGEGITSPSFYLCQPPFGLGPDARQPRLWTARGATLWTSAGRRRGLVGPGQRQHLALEVPRIVETLVDAGEAHVGHLVQRPQPLQHDGAHPGAGHLGAFEAERFLHIGGQALELLDAEGPVLGRRSHTGDHLAPAERLPL